RAWHPERQRLECCGTRVREGPRIPWDVRRAQESPSDESPDPALELDPGQTDEVCVVEKVRQRQTASWAGHVALLKDDQGCPLGTIESRLEGHTSTSPSELLSPLASRWYLWKHPTDVPRVRS